MADHISRCARICHEANRVYCASLGDDSQIPWDDAPARIKDSAMAGVKLHFENPHVAPSASHEAWTDYKIAEGWIWGETKDPVLKTHPCLVPFDQLPSAQQFKDVLFQAIIHAYVAGVQEG